METAARTASSSTPASPRAQTVRPTAVPPRPSDAVLGIGEATEVTGPPDMLKMLPPARGAKKPALIVPDAPPRRAASVRPIATLVEDDGPRPFEPRPGSRDRIRQDRAITAREIDVTEAIPGAVDDQHLAVDQSTIHARPVCQPGPTSQGRARELRTLAARNIDCK